MLLNNLGRFALEQGDLERARSLLAGSIECFEQLGAEHSLAARSNLAEVHLRNGEFAKARELFGDVLAGANRASDELAVADIRLQLAWIACFEGSHQEAIRLVRETIPDYVRLGATLDSARCMFVAALACAAGGRLDDAARLVGAASATRQRLGRPPLLEGIYAHPIERLEHELRPEHYVAAYDEGAAMSFESALELLETALGAAAAPHMGTASPAASAANPRQLDPAPPE